jgi:hypothetical protein
MLNIMKKQKKTKWQKIKIDINKFREFVSKLIFDKEYRFMIS